MNKSPRYRTVLAGAIVTACMRPAFVNAEGAGFDEEVVVVAPTPTSSNLGLDPSRLPFTVQAADSDALRRSQSLDLTDYLNTNLGSVSINSAQGNPLQPDVQYRGFSASPLLGLPMGISVYQNGVRINEPLGDAVNWDMVPESAIHSMTLVGGSNPLFGLNTLGGALSLEMKNGFNYQGTEGEVSGGSWGRVVTSVESGGNNGTLGYYLNVHYFDEEGWRDHSPSNALNLFSAFSWRGEAGALDLNVQYGDSDLVGNGSTPIGLLRLDREGIFTAPDITGNETEMVSLKGLYDFSEEVEFAGNGFYRRNKTDSFNGDSSGFTRCGLGNRDFLIDGLEAGDLEGLIAGNQPLDRAQVCRNNVLGVADPNELENALNALAGSSRFKLEDLTGELAGTGVIADEAINNGSRREQEAYGTDLQLILRQTLFARDNFFVAGFNYFNGRADLNSRVELSGINPTTRSTVGLGVGTFLTSEAVNVATSNDTWSLYFLDNFSVTDRFTLTAGGRYNSTEVTLDDRSGQRPELNGDHHFSRFNPTVGATYSPAKGLNLYTNYSESSRAPTPVELACNEGVFDIARKLAETRGQDPNDVNFECRLPNAFLADPPLNQVVAETIEAGVRGSWHGLQHRVGWFRTTNNDDIIFQSTGRSTGLFANVDQTRRQGLEAALTGSRFGLDWFMAYSYIEATFESDFAVLSPHHPAANADGEIAVSSGDRIPGIPRHQLKVGADHRFATGLAMGVEVLYNSDQVLRGDESNRLKPVSGYAVVNLHANYPITKKLEIFARITNLFDSDYENFGLLGEDPTRVIPALNDGTPHFLGPGAPRGAWVGARLRL